MPIKHDRECEVCQKQFDTRAKLANMWRNDVFVVRIVLEWCCSFFPCACQPGTHMKNVHPFNAACRKASVIVFPSARCALQITKSEQTHVGIGDGAKRHVLRMLDLQEGVQ